MKIKIKTEKNFLHHFKNYFTGNLITKLLSLVTLPIITKYLSPEDYGFYAVFMAYVSFAAVIITLNLSSSIGRFWYDDVNIKEYIGSSFIAVIIVIIFLSFPSYYILYKYAEYDITLYILLLAYVLFLTVSSIFQQVYISLHKSRLISTLDVIKSVLIFCFTLFFMIYGDKKFSLIYAGLVVGIIFMILHFYYLSKYLSLKLNISYLKQNINYSMPLIFYVLSSLVFVNIDKIMLERYIGLETAGMYSFAFNFGMILSGMIIFPLLTAWTPTYFEDMNNKNYIKIENDFLLMFKIILSASLLLMSFSKELAFILFDSRYYEGFLIIPYVLLSLIFLFLWQVFGRNIGYAKKTIYIALISIFMGLFNILLNYIFIPKFQMYGAVLSTLVSYVFMAILGYIVSRFFLKQHTINLIKTWPLMIIVVLYTFLYEHLFFLFELVIYDILIKIICLLLIFIYIFNKELTILLKKKDYKL